MLATLFKSISDQAVAAAQAAPVPVKLNDPDTYAYHQGGQLHTFDRGPRPRRLQFLDLYDFLDFLDTAAAHSLYLSANSAGILAHAALDERNRESAHITLPWHPTFDAIAAWNDGRAQYHQREIITLFAQDLRGMISPKLAEAVRTITAQTTSSQSIQNTRERGTREFAVEAANELPDEIDAAIPFLQQYPDKRAAITLFLTVTPPPPAFAFQLRVLRHEIDAATETALASVWEDVRKYSEDNDYSAPWTKAIYRAEPPRQTATA